MARPGKAPRHRLRLRASQADSGESTALEEGQIHGPQFPATLEFFELNPKLSFHENTHCVCVTPYSSTVGGSGQRDSTRLERSPHSFMPLELVHNQRQIKRPGSAARGR